MNKGLWNRLLKGMKNDELANLSSLIHKEQRRRAEKRISEGRFSELEENEIDLLRDVGRAKATLAYRERTNCPLVMAKMVVDNFYEQDVPQDATLTYVAEEVVE